MTHICIGYLTIIGWDNGLSPGRCQANIWTNAGIILIKPYGRNFSEILIEMHTLSFKKMHLNGCLQNGGHFVSASMCWTNNVSHSRRLTDNVYQPPVCKEATFSWWRHKMETFSASLAFVRGIHWSPVNSPHKGQWREFWCFLWSAPEQTVE